MEKQFARTALLLKEENMHKLENMHICVFGIGGVGGYVVEALARTGIGKFTLVDDDEVSESNINRQIIATYKSVGMAKVDVMKERILSINPKAIITVRKCFYLPENADSFDFSQYDYVVDCVDTVSAKISIVTKATEKGIKVISAMGAGNKMNPTMLEVADIYKTSVDPLAKVMRHELKKRNIKHLKVVFSKEEPIKIQSPSIEENKEPSTRKGTPKKNIPGSNAFVPSAMGLIMASEIIKDLIK